MCLCFAHSDKDFVSQLKFKCTWCSNKTQSLQMPTKILHRGYHCWEEKDWQKWLFLAMFRTLQNRHMKILACNDQEPCQKEQENSFQEAVWFFFCLCLVIISKTVILAFTWCQILVSLFHDGQNENLKCMHKHTLWSFTSLWAQSLKTGQNHW